MGSTQTWTSNIASTSPRWSTLAYQVQEGVHWCWQSCTRSQAWSVHPVPDATLPIDYFIPSSALDVPCPVSIPRSASRKIPAFFPALSAFMLSPRILWYFCDSTRWQNMCPILATGGLDWATSNFFVDSNQNPFHVNLQHGIFVQGKFIPCSTPREWHNESHIYFAKCMHRRCYEPSLLPVLNSDQISSGWIPTHRAPMIHDYDSSLLVLCSKSCYLLSVCWAEPIESKPALL